MGKAQLRFHEDDIPLVVVLNSPAPLAVDILAITADNLVGNDAQMAIGLVAQEFLEKGTDDWAHATRQDDDWDIILLGPVVELQEIRVQLHVLQQLVDTLVEWGLYAVEHFKESVTRNNVLSISISIPIHDSILTGSPKSRPGPSR